MLTHALLEEGDVGDYVALVVHRGGFITHLEPTIDDKGNRQAYIIHSSIALTPCWKCSPKDEGMCRYLRERMKPQ